jgi:hypothetical protein
VAVGSGGLDPHETERINMKMIRMRRTGFFMLASTVSSA